MHQLSEQGLFSGQSVSSQHGMSPSSANVLSQPGGAGSPSRGGQANTGPADVEAVPVDVEAGPVDVEAEEHFLLPARWWF